MKKIFSRKYLTYAIVLAAVVLIVWAVRGRKPAALETVTVKRATIVQTVDVTGQLKPSENLNLSFETSGRVAKVLVDVGSKVRIGETLATLSAGETYANLKQAEANLLTQQARLDEILRGTRPENIAISETDLKKSEQDLTNLYAGASDSINSAYSNADDAVRKQLDNLFTDDETINPRLVFQVSDSQTKINAESSRQSASKELNDWKDQISSLGSSLSASATDAVLPQSLNHLSKIRSFLNYVADALTSQFNVDSSTLISYRANLNTARSEVNSAISSLNDLTQNIAAQKITVEKAKNQLALQQAGSTPEQISAQRAQVAQAEAAVESAQVSVGKTILRSPINGTITKRNVDPGEIVSVVPGITSNPILSAISEDKLEIEANVPEVDIGKVQIGNPVDITFDAFPGEKFTAQVTFIDPAETIVDGVTNFRVKSALSKNDSRLKSGLTANLSIQTLRKENVLALPQYALKETDTGIFVSKMENGKSKDTQVKTGVKGEDGMVEIVSGVSEGETVVNVGAKKS